MGPITIIQQQLVRDSARASDLNDTQELHPVGQEGDTPKNSFTVQPTWPTVRQSLARVYNRVGGLMQRLANESQVEVPAVLAVWYVESSGREHTPGRAIIRFENHILFDQWGKANPAVYDRHFRHGGRPPAMGPECLGPSGRFAPWKCHAFRKTTDGPFVTCHQGQTQEYEVLELAASLAGEDVAFQCMSIGGPQIMGFHFRRLGFRTPREMYDAFQGGEGGHVQAFFTFCQTLGTSGQAIRGLRARDWETFARLYNGSGNVATYATLMRSAYEQARQLF